MKCKRVQKLISGYLDDELHTDEREAVESHVRDCRICAERLRESQGVNKIFGAVPKYAAPAYFAAKVMANLEKDGRKSSWFDFFSGVPAYLKMVEIALAVIVVTIGAVSGNLVTLGEGHWRPAEIRSYYSLDVFDPAPPGSIGAAFMSVMGGDHE